MRRLICLPVLLSAIAASALASVDSGLLSLLPAEAKIVGSVDVSQARNSEFGQYLLTKAQSEDSHFQEMIDQTGFDPRRDLQDVVFETSGEPGKSSSFAILARGNFDPERIKTLAKSKGASVETYQGVDLILHSKEHGEETAVGFPEVGVAVMADIVTLKEIIENRSTPSQLDPQLKSKIQSIGASNDAWYVSLVGGGFLAQHGGNDAAPQAKALQGVVQSSGGLKLGATIDTTFDAVTRSPQDASSLSDVIRFMTSMLQMQRQNDPRAEILAAALDGMTLQSSGNTVHCAVSMPEKTLEQLADMGPMAMGAHPHHAK